MIFRNFTLGRKLKHKLNHFIEGTGVPRVAAKEVLLRRAIATLPNKNIERFLLPDLEIDFAERLDDDLVAIKLTNGRIFYGQRSEQKQYLIYNFLKPYLPESVDGDCYKLAYDIQDRYCRSSEELASSLPDKPVMIEGGCFTGIKALNWVDNLNPGLIVAVEIGKKNYEVLKKNIKENNLEETVIPVHAGLWKENGIGTQKHNFTTRRFLSATDQWKPHMKHEEQVNLLTIDTLIEQHNLDHVDYLNIQVNGAEREVCQGISLSKDKIKQVSIASYYSDDGEQLVDEVIQIMESKGFELSGRLPGGRVSFAVAN